MTDHHKKQPAVCNPYEPPNATGIATNPTENLPQFGRPAALGAVILVSLAFISSVFTFLVLGDFFGLQHLLWGNRKRYSYTDLLVREIVVYELQVVLSLIAIVALPFVWRRLPKGIRLGMCPAIFFIAWMLSRTMLPVLRSYFLDATRGG